MIFETEIKKKLRERKKTSVTGLQRDIDTY